MRKLVVSEFISLDGVIQAPGGADEDTDGGFAYGGWTHPYWHDEIGALFGAAMQESDAKVTIWLPKGYLHPGTTPPQYT